MSPTRLVEYTGQQTPGRQAFDRYRPASSPWGLAAEHARSILARFVRRFFDTGSRVGAVGDQVVLFTNAESLGTLRDQWEALEPAAFGPMENFEWSQSGAAGLPGPMQLQIYTAWERGRCDAIAPLSMLPGFGAHLESIGAKELGEPVGFLYSSRPALARLCDALARNPVPIVLPRISADAALIKELRRAYRGRGWVRVHPTTPYPSFAIDASSSAPESHFNARRRSDFRRAQRHAEQLGSTRFEVLTPEPSQLEALLSQAYAVEMRGWKGRAGSALALDASRADFFQRYFAACCKKGNLRIAFMRIGVKAVAMQLAIESGQRLWLIRIGHDEAFSRSSPGTLLMLQMARYAAQRGLRSIEFLGCDEPWTRVWTTSLRECIRIRVYPFTRAGLARWALDAWIWLATRMTRKLKSENF